MDEESSRNLDLLKSMRLFIGLEDEELKQVARLFKIQHVRAGIRLFSQGDLGDEFFIILRGRVQISREDGSSRRELAVFKPGDYFGEETLLFRRRRSATVTVIETADFLVTDRLGFQELLQKVPHSRSFFELAVESHKNTQRMRLNWIGKDEVIYLLIRKHYSVLWTSFTLPFLAALLSLLFFFVYYLIGFSLVLIGGVVILFAAMLWGVWNWIDWGNDYYILTDRRVVWLERVVGIYDSRQEAPLRTVLSVNATTDQIGRMLGYGDVIVRTFTGKIILRTVSHAEQMAEVIQEHCDRVKELRKKDDKVEIERHIRERLDLPVSSVQTTAVETEETTEKPVKPSAMRRFFVTLLKVRYEDGEVVTYRKHWFLLIQHSWKPFLCMVISIFIPAYLILNKYTFLTQTTIGFIGCASFVLCFLWWIYAYIDWRNDIYLVTPDQIVDIDRTPLGREEKRSAPLENILSLDYERTGILGRLLNFGNVNALVGGVKFTFEGVFNPSAVQQDIFRRIDARMYQKQEEEAVRERQRMTDWIEVYHHSIEGNRREDGSLTED
ncbi:MAG: cyclic nucleotide-binding domain-containing protein [Chloroflexota bacterium]